MQFDVRYYLVAILFILFDLEIAFMFPWAVVLKELGMQIIDIHFSLKWDFQKSSGLVFMQIEYYGSIDPIEEVLSLYKGHQN